MKLTEGTTTTNSATVWSWKPLLMLKLMFQLLLWKWWPDRPTTSPHTRLDIWSRTLALGVGRCLKGTTTKIGMNLFSISFGWFEQAQGECWGWSRAAVSNLLFFNKQTTLKKLKWLLMSDIPYINSPNLSTQINWPAEFLSKLFWFCPFESSECKFHDIHLRKSYFTKVSRAK